MAQRKRGAAAGVRRGARLALIASVPALVVGTWGCGGARQRERQGTGACGSAISPDAEVPEVLRARAIPLDADGAINAVADRLAGARVVGLGEATHGQREVFAFKRALTMAMIRSHGVRVVALEASASGVRACDAYVSGEGEDRRAAIAGLGMLIWQVEEVAALLDDLRAWNTRGEGAERLRVIGVDVQDSAAAAERLAALAEEAASGAGAEARAIAAALEGAVRELWSGRIEAWTDLAARAAALEARVGAACSGDGERPREARLRAMELRLGVEMFRTHGGRDAAMAAMLLEQVGRGAAAPRAVVWGHNAHVSRGRLGYLGSDEPAMGGCLARDLGAAYSAVGVVFGEGEFVALDQDGDGVWRFRTYTLRGVPSGSVEHEVGRAVGGQAAVVDLRGVVDGTPLAAWARASRGYRWFGGYRVPTDVERETPGAGALGTMTPGEEFDLLAYFPRTMGTKPVDPSRASGGR